MFSFLTEKFRKKKTPPDVTDLYLAEDALETDLANSNIESMKCVASEAFILDSKKQPINTTLVQGASKSKAKSQIPSENHRFERVSSPTKDSHVSIAPDPEIASVRHVLHRASLHTLAPSRLYPSLDPINTPERSSSATLKVIQNKQSKSIHDIANEICLMIEPRILYAATIEKELNRLRGDAHKYVLNIRDMIKNSSKFEYDFTTELDSRKNYSHVKVSENLHSFDDVQKCHKRVNEPIKRKMAKNRNAVPVFQSYRKGLRCYNGKKLDIIDCD